ncbi:outer membrane beta-barrel protein [Zunongwangia sp. F363]|uniref:Outer membrane beta-barrel protein n=1 Tax=Autumnicola tepida TaxID=3075595 RepID=A0ABU3CE56_9FLAO|nr:outer membrane beta-barrel protein [Zunongwangia sp. F363]MDT0644305.1 outer membrane beta-barrel protein [Zunongwangia sp. F363]
MKNLLLAAMLFFASVSFTQAQEVNFGVSAGYTNITGRSSNSTSSIESSASSSGFYLGALADFSLSENFHLHPEVNFAIADETNFLVVPVFAQYYIGDSSFYLQAGPQATFLLEDTMGILDTFGLDLAFGAGYHINENFFLQAKYSFEITNRLSSDAMDILESQGQDGDSGFDAFTVGVGYKF